MFEVVGVGYPPDVQDVKHSAAHHARSDSVLIMRLGAQHRADPGQPLLGGITRVRLGGDRAVNTQSE